MGSEEKVESNRLIITLTQVKLTITAVCSVITAIAAVAIAYAKLESRYVDTRELLQASIEVNSRVLKVAESYYRERKQLIKDHIDQLEQAKNDFTQKISNIDSGENVELGIFETKERLEKQISDIDNVLSRRKIELDQLESDFKAISEPIDEVMKNLF